jgi:hypothetical protein
LFGSAVVWGAIQKSYPTDDKPIKEHFKGLDEDKTGLREAVIEYFEFGIGIYAIYASLVTSTISSIGLLATYLPKLINFGFGARGNMK